MTPKPTSVRYNDWRQVNLPTPETFTPTRPVSVIIPYYQTPPETLARTLASLERQTYPKDLFEVVIADDGSQPPLERPPSTSLDIRVVRQKRCGFGAGRARNNGARVAAHDILLFLDSDMLVEAEWIAAHARWHHVVSDALTMGFNCYVAVDDLDAKTIRCRTGSLRELFSDRPADPPWFEAHMLRTNDLTSRSDDLFRVKASGNFAMRKDFFDLVGGFDESFVRYGLEDTELGYRAYNCGALLVPARDAQAWHQSRWPPHWDDVKDRNFRIQYGKAAHLIAHRGLRGTKPGRIYRVPQFVVNVDAGHLPAEQVIKTVELILAARIHDLGGRIETPARDDDDRRAWLRDVFGPEPRVRVAPARSALDDFPAAPFHVTLPASAVFARNLVHRLRTKLRSAVTAAAVCPDGRRVSITRAWALHRARRTAMNPADFGEALTLSPAALKLKLKAGTASTRPTGSPTNLERLLYVLQDVRGPKEAYTTLKRLTKAVRWYAAFKRAVARRQ